MSKRGRQKGRVRDGGRRDGGSEPAVRKSSWRARWARYAKAAQADWIEGSKEYVAGWFARAEAEDLAWRQAREGQRGSEAPDGGATPDAPKVVRYVD